MADNFSLKKAMADFDKELEKRAPDLWKSSITVNKYLEREDLFFKATNWVIDTVSEAIELGLPYENSDYHETQQLLLSKCKNTILKKIEGNIMSLDIDELYVMIGMSSQNSKTHRRNFYLVNALGVLEYLSLCLVKKGILNKEVLNAKKIFFKDLYESLEAISVHSDVTCDYLKEAKRLGLVKGEDGASQAIRKLSNRAFNI